MRRNKILTLSFILPILVMIIVIYLLDLYPFSDRTLNSGDFNLQYLPLYAGLKAMVNSGDFRSLFWSFQKSLGGAMASVWGFNSLSPLTLMYAFVPTQYFSEISLLTTLLRYGLMGLSFAYFLCKRYPVSDTKTYLPIIFSTSYALSGFMVAHTINPNFLDNLVYLPLLLMLVEEVLDGRLTWKFPLLVAISIVTQFYIAYMLCFFLVIYSCYYLFRSGGNTSTKLMQWLKFLGLLLLGVGISSIWLVPVISGLLASKAAAGPTFVWSWDQLNHPLQYLAKFVTGSFDSQEWGDSQAMPQLFIGALGFIGLIHYFLSSKFNGRDKLATTIVIIFLIVSFSFDFPDRVWHMGQRPNGFFFRNAWVATSFLLITSYRSLARDISIPTKQTRWYVLISLIVVSLVYQTTYSFIESWQLAMTLFIWLIIILILEHHRSIIDLSKLLLLISLLDLGLNATIGLGRTAYFLSHQNINVLVSQDSQYKSLLPDTDEFYRMEMNKGVMEANLPLVDHYNGVSHFTSSLEYQLISNLAKLGLPTSTSFVNYTNRMPLTDSLFAIKYYVDQEPISTNLPDLLAIYRPLQELNHSKVVYRNNYSFGPALMVGKEFNDFQLTNNPVQNQNSLLQFLFNDQREWFQPINIQEISLQNLSKNGQIFTRNQEGMATKLELSFIPEDKAVYYLLIPAEAEQAIKQSQISLSGQPYLFADRFTSDQLWPVAYDSLGQSVTLSLMSSSVAEYPLDRMELYRFDIEAYQKAVTDKKLDSLILDKYQPWLFNFSVPNTLSAPQPVFTSIPYNSGWSIKVDGKDIQPYKVWDTFLGFDLTEGSQVVEVSFYPPGLRAGIILSLLSLVLVFFWSYSHRKRMS